MVQPLLINLLTPPLRGVILVDLSSNVKLVKSLCNKFVVCFFSGFFQIANVVVCC